MKHPLIKKLEKKLLPEFEKVAKKIRQEIPNIMVTVNGYTVGSATQYQGYGFYIDCTLTDASYDETDNVALGVSLGHLTTFPKIDADVFGDIHQERAKHLFSIGVAHFQVKTQPKFPMKFWKICIKNCQGFMTHYLKH